MKKDEFKVGDTVYCMMYGKGVVININEEEYYSVIVKLEYGIEKTYTIDGAYYENTNRTLFFEEIPIPNSAYIRPKWRAKSGSKYFFVNSIGVIKKDSENYTETDNASFNLGNYFQTEEEAKQSKFYKVFHEVRE